MARNTRIKAARSERDLTQKALAEAVGISRQTMNAIEQGDYNPTIKLCRAICRELGKNLDELFGEPDSDEKGGTSMYCTQCKHMVEGERCPHCGSKKLRLPERDDLCFLTEQEYLWSEMLQDVLRQHAIPVFTQNYLGAGITSKIGCLMEKVSFYVPYARYAEAQDLVTALFSETGEEEEDP